MIALTGAILILCIAVLVLRIGSTRFGEQRLDGNIGKDDRDFTDERLSQNQDRDSSAALPVR